MSEQEQAQKNVLQELKASQDVLAQVTASLEQQATILKARNVRLPPMVMKSLVAMERDLRGIEGAIVDEEQELVQLRALADMSAQINQSLDVDTILQETMDIVIALTGAERGYLVMLDPETDEWYFRIIREDSIMGNKNPDVEPQISRSVLTHVITHREPLLADNAFQDERFQSQASVANLSLRSVLCVPLMYKDDIFGVVYVDNRLQAGIFTEREKNTLTAFANTASVAIANAQYYQDIQDLLAQVAQVKELMDGVFASIGSGVIATDADDTITTFNRAAQAILELSEDDAHGKPLQDVLPKISTDLHEYLVAIREKGDVQMMDTEMNTSARGRIALNLKLAPLKDMEAQTTQGVAIVLDDVTETRQRENELRVMKTYLPPEMVENIHTISRLALGGERREVTCLFVEVRPISTLKDVRPREVMDILNVFLSVATEAIQETQGVIDKYMGQEVMAMWNTQLNPMQNHAEMAIECALRMREKFIALYAELGINPEPHYYRVGIHSGVATLGNVGSINRRDFTAIGDTINLSKRLEENATRQQIIISQDSLEQLQAHHDNDINALTFEERAPIKVKGRQQETRIYEVFRA
jgi:adenylate cyclase